MYFNLRQINQIANSVKEKTTQTLRGAKQLPLLLSLLPTVPSFNDLSSLEVTSFYQPLQTEQRKESKLNRYFTQTIQARIQKISANNLSLEQVRKLSRDITDAIGLASFELHVDPFEILALIETESHYNAHAIGKFGEIGLTQIKPKTAFWIVPDGHRFKAKSREELFGVYQNIYASAFYLSYLDRYLAKKIARDPASVLGSVANSPTPHKTKRVLVFRSYNEGFTHLHGEIKEASIENDPEWALAPENLVTAYSISISKRAELFRNGFINSIN